jgi:hypothetical protein
MVGMDDRPTVRQVYALAAVLCERDGEAFPATSADASELIERLRLKTGHPAPRLSDVPFRPRRWRARRGRWRGGPGLRVYEWRASDVAAELVSEMR